MNILTTSCKINLSEDRHRSQLTSLGQSRKRTFRNVIGSVLSAVNPIKNRKGIDLIDKKQKDYRIGGAFILNLTSVALKKCRPVLTSIKIKTKVSHFHNSLLTQYRRESCKRCSYNLGKSRGRPFITDIIPFNHPQFLDLLSDTYKKQPTIEYAATGELGLVNTNLRQAMTVYSSNSGGGEFHQSQRKDSLEKVDAAATSFYNNSSNKRVNKGKPPKVEEGTEIDRVSGSHAAETASPPTTPTEELLVAPNIDSQNGLINSSEVDEDFVSLNRHQNHERYLTDKFMWLKMNLGRTPTLAELADAGFSMYEIDLMETLTDWVISESNDLENWEPISTVMA